MIFFFDGTLTPLQTNPQSIHENSSNAYAITVIAPFSASTTFTVSVKNALGEVFTDMPMTYKGSTNINVNGATFNVWEFPVLNYFSAFNGRLTAQFSAFTGNATVTSTECVIPVLKGVPKIPSAVPDADTWGDIQNALTNILNVVYDTTALPASGWVYDYSGYASGFAAVVGYEGSSGATKIKIPPYVVYDYTNAENETTRYYLSVVNVSLSDTDAALLKDTVEDIILPDTLVSIGANAAANTFGKFSEVKKLKIPENVTYLRGQCLPYSCEVIEFNASLPTIYATVDGTNYGCINNAYGWVNCIIVCPKRYLSDYATEFASITPRNNSNTLKIQVTYLDEATIFTPAGATDNVITDIDNKARIVLRKPISMYSVSHGKVVAYYSQDFVINGVLYYIYHSVYSLSDAAQTRYVMVWYINSEDYSFTTQTLNLRTPYFYRVDVGGTLINPNAQIESDGDATFKDVTASGNVIADAVLRGLVLSIGGTLANPLATIDNLGKAKFAEVETNASKVNGNATVGGTLEVDGAASLKGGAAVTGNETVSGTITAGGKLTVESGGADITGDVYVTHNVTVEGDIEADDVQVDGALQVYNEGSSYYDAKTEFDKVEAVEDILDVSNPRPSTTDPFASQSFVNSSVENVAAYYITDSQGHPFASYSALVNTPLSGLYSGGSQRNPTQNDYTLVEKDEEAAILISGYTLWDDTSDYVGSYVNTGTEQSPVYVLVTGSNKGSLGIVPGTTKAYTLPTTRYSYQVGDVADYDPATDYNPDNWVRQWVVNASGLTAAQVEAINSGITAELVTTGAKSLKNIQTFIPNDTNATTNPLVNKNVRNLTYYLDAAAVKTLFVDQIGRTYVYDKLIFIVQVTANQTVEFYHTGTNVTVDWGDGTINGNISHEYTADGVYVIYVDGATSFTFDGRPGRTALVAASIPSTMTSINSNAFNGCWDAETQKGLLSVQIPSSVTSIGDDAFSGCTGLAEVYYKGTSSAWTALQSSVGTGNTALSSAVKYYLTDGSEVTFTPQTLSDPQKEQARTNIGAAPAPTTAQQNAWDSGATAQKITAYDAHIINKNNPHEVTKAQVGLGNVDNTSDLDKPISTATQTALNSKADASSLGLQLVEDSNGDLYYN